MELSTSHLAHFTMQFRLVGTGSNQIDLILAVLDNHGAFH